MSSRLRVDVISRRRMYEFQPLVLREHEVRSRERPKGRSGHRIVCDNKNMYSFGGFNPCVAEDDPEMQDDETWLMSKPLFRELWKFNFVSQRWKRLPSHEDMPNEVASSAVVLKDRTLVVYGGTGVPFGASCSNSLYTCDLQNGAMKILPSRGSPPEAQYGQAMITLGPYLYTVGGTTGYEYTCDIHRYDLRNDQWETIYICSGDATEPKGRYRHELAFDGNIIYVLGGGTANEAFDFQAIPAFVLTTNKWTLLGSQKDPIYNALPAPRRCHGLVQYTNEKTGDISVVISGGYTGLHEFRDVWRLDLKTLQWTCLAKCFLPSPMYFHSVALTPQGKMYTFGGIIKISNGVTRTDAVHSTWLVIPKLQEICWEALSYYIKDLGRRPRDELAMLGIPLQFLHRLDNNER